jgi:hypothetical protein
MVAHTKSVNRVEVDHLPKRVYFLVIVDYFQDFYQDLITKNWYIDLSWLGGLLRWRSGCHRYLYFRWFMQRFTWVFPHHKFYYVHHNLTPRTVFMKIDWKGAAIFCIPKPLMIIRTLLFPMAHVWTSICPPSIDNGCMLYLPVQKCTG